MNSFIIGILSGGIVLAVAAIIVLRRHYRKIIREKDRGIVRRIHERDRLARELEYSNMEKNMLEKIAEKKMDKVIILESSGRFCKKTEGTGKNSYTSEITNY
jgi:hypothetical protein